METVRLYFKFKGTLHRRFIESSVDWEINVEDNTYSDDSLFWHCEEILSLLITWGLVDFHCCHGVDDFELLRYEINPEGEAEMITTGISEYRIGH